MRELIVQILIHARGAWRYRWYAIGTAWSIAIIGWAIVVTIPDMYEAHARVYVDTDSILRPLLSGLAVNTDTAGRVNMVARMITSRPHLERVAHETGLADRTHTPQEFAKLVTALSHQITVEDSSGGNIYSLRYADRDPAMAQRVVQRVLDTFVEDTLGLKRADSGSAQQFLQTQIHEYGMRLKQAEDRLAEFKRQNFGLMPGESGDYFARLQTENNKLSDLRARFQLASERRAELQKQLEGEEPTFGLFTDSAGDAGGASEIDGQIAAYRKQLAQLLLQYTDKHPEVIALKQTISELEAQKAAQSDTKPLHGGSVPVPRDRSEAAALALDINPVYQNLRLDLSRTEVDLADLRGQLDQEERVVNDLKSRVNTMPSVEAKLTQLTRDYDVTKGQYQQLLQRLDSARLSEQAEASNDQIKFRIIEPPVRALTPSGPNRVLFATSTLLIALAAGIALAIALDQLNPVFLSRGMLASVTGLPVLGSISFITPRPAGSAWRNEHVRVGLASGALLIAYFVAAGTADFASRVVHRLMG